MFKSCVLLCAGLIASIFAIASHAQTEAAVAYAKPMAGIDVDGSLDDWPADMIRHPLLSTFRVYGDTDLDLVDLMDNPDCQGYFMVGWNPDTSMIQLAVVVRDDTLSVTEGRSEFTDAIEVYVSGTQQPEANAIAAMLNMAGDREVLQYNYVPGPGSYSTPNNPGAYGLPIDRVRTRAAHQRKGDVTIYEWSIEAFEAMDVLRPVELKGGQRLGFDVTIVDCDGPKDVTAFVGWGPLGGFKYSNRDKVGEIVIMAADDALLKVQGSLVDAAAQREVIGKKIVEFINEQGAMAGIARTDAQGRFSIDLPAGTYTARAAAWQALHAGDGVQFTVAADKPADVKVTATRVALPEILRKSAAAYANAKTYRDRTEMVVEARRGDNIGGVGAGWNLTWQSPNKLQIKSSAESMGNMLLASDGEHYSLQAMSAGQAVRQVQIAGGQVVQMQPGAPQNVLSAGEVPDRLDVVGVRRMMALTGNYGGLQRFGGPANASVSLGQYHGGSASWNLSPPAMVILPYAHRLLWSTSPLDELQVGLAHARLVGKDLLDGEPVTVVELDKRVNSITAGVAPCGPGIGQLSTLRLWIGDRDALIRRAEWQVDVDRLGYGDRQPTTRTSMSRYIEQHIGVQSDVELPEAVFQVQREAQQAIP